MIPVKCKFNNIACLHCIPPASPSKAWIDVLTVCVRCALLGCSVMLFCTRPQSIALSAWLLALSAVDRSMHWKSKSPFGLTFFFRISSQWTSGTCILRMWCSKPRHKTACSRLCLFGCVRQLEGGFELHNLEFHVFFSLIRSSENSWVSSFCLNNTENYVGANEISQALDYHGVIEKSFTNDFFFAWTNQSYNISDTSHSLSASNPRHATVSHVGEQRDLFCVQTN